MKKLVSFFSMLLVFVGGLLPLFPSDTVAAADDTLLLDQCYLYDEADVLTDAQEEELDQCIAETAETIQMNIFVRLGSRYVESSSDARYNAKTDYINHFGNEKDSDGVALFLDLHGTYTGDTSYAPHDYIVTHGLAQLYYTNDEDGSDRISEIFSQMNPHMKRGQEDPYTAVTIFCENLVSYYQKGIPEDYYVYDYSYEQYLYVDESTGEAIWSYDVPPSVQKEKTTHAFLISFLIGLIIAVIVFFVIRRHYRFRSAPSANIYIPSEGITYGASKDRFLRKQLISTPIAHSDSSDGGFFDGGDFGGGSSSGGFGGGGNDR